MILKKTLDKDICAGGFLIILALLGFIASSQIENMAVTRLSGAFYPNILFSILIICGIGLIYQGKKRKNKEAIPSFKWKKLIQMVIVLLLYVFLMEYIGFVLSTVLFMIVSMFLYGERRAKILLPVSIVISVVVYLLFTKAFMIILPTMPGLGI